MDSANNPRTTRDALIHELIGDVGRLDDNIKSLPVALNKVLEPTKEELREIQSNLLEQLAALPGAADKELKRAGDAAISSLSTEVGKIAQKIAGDAAAATAADAKIEAARWQAGMLLVGLAVGFICTYLGVTGVNASNMSTARERVAAADRRADTAEADAKKRADDAIAAIRKNAVAAVAAASAQNAWGASTAGLVAQHLDAAGDLARIATCSGAGWVKQRAASGEVWCSIPQSDGWFSTTKLLPQFRVYDTKK